MSAKKPYSPPQIFQVELNHEQAILTACSLTATTLRLGDARTGCELRKCKQGKIIEDGVLSDSGARLS